MASDTDTSNVLTLADGTQINMRTGRPARQNGVPSGYVAVPSHSEAVQELVRVRKRIADLPDVPERMNIVAVIAAYYMFGLSDLEISVALNCTQGQVENIKMTDAFSRLVEAMTENLVESQQDDVRSLLARGARKAATGIIDMMDSDDDKVAVVAMRDVLDRAGHRAVDVVEHRHRVEGGLTIEYVKRSDGDDRPPALDLDPTQYMEDNDGDDS